MEWDVGGILKRLNGIVIFVGGGGTVIGELESCHHKTVMTR